MIFTNSVARTYTIPSNLFFRRWAEKVEKLRIKLHLFCVEIELRTKSTRRLSQALRKERQKNILRLREYRKAGVFPKNTDRFGERIPHFKDKYGTPCAVGYLMERSGECDLVQTIAWENNYIYIDDIAVGPAMEWIKKSGLSKKEAARIQPGYPTVCVGVEFLCNHMMITYTLASIIGVSVFGLCLWILRKTQQMVTSRFSREVLTGNVFLIALFLIFNTVLVFVTYVVYLLAYVDWFRTSMFFGLGSNIMEILNVFGIAIFLVLQVSYLCSRANISENKKKYARRIYAWLALALMSSVFGIFAAVWFYSEAVPEKVLPLGTDVSFEEPFSRKV